MTRLIPHLTEAERVEFIATAQSLLTGNKKRGPVRFKHMGRSTKGIDCIGVPVWTYREMGLGTLVHDLDRYSRAPDGVTLREALRAHLGPAVKLAAGRAGDIALMRWYDKRGEGSNVGWHNHVGILTDYPYGGLALLHSYLGNRKVVQHRIDAVWARRIVEVYRT